MPEPIHIKRDTDKIKTPENIEKPGNDLPHIDINKILPNNNELWIYNSKGIPVFQVLGDETTLIIEDKEGVPVFKVSGDKAALTIGEKDHNGQIWLKNSQNIAVCRLTGSKLSIGEKDVYGTIVIKDINGNDSIFLGRDQSGMTVITVKNDQGKDAIQLDGNHAKLIVGGNSNNGHITIKNDNGEDRVLLEGYNGNIEASGYITAANIKALSMMVQNPQKNTSILLDGEIGRISTKDVQGNDSIILDGESKIISLENSGEILLKNSQKNISISLDGKLGRISTKDDQRNDSIIFDGKNGNIEALGYITADDIEASNTILVKDAQKNTSIILDGKNKNIFLQNSKNERTITLNGETGDIYLEGADCAEEFNVESENIVPGTVLVIGADEKLTPCEEPFDKKVAGVVSGASGYKPSIILDKKGAQKNRLPIALTGKTYCKVDANYTSIEIGDLLTTSPTTGHAMKADDPFKAFGSVIGKALSPLEEGQGMIPILITLQ